MDRRRRTRAERREIEALEDVQHLDQRDAARRRRREREHLEAAIGAAHGRAGRAGSRRDRSRRARRRGASRRRRSPCARRPSKKSCGPAWAIARRLAASSGWRSVQPGAIATPSGGNWIAAVSGKRAASPIPFHASSMRAWRSEIGKPSSASAIAGAITSASDFVPQRSSASARPASRLGVATASGPARDASGATPGATNMSRVAAGGRGFARVERDHVAVRESDQQEAAAAETRVIRLGDAEREGRRDGRVDRVAARPQHREHRPPQRGARLRPPCRACRRRAPALRCVRRAEPRATPRQRGARRRRTV